MRPDLHFVQAGIAVEIDGPPHLRIRTLVDDQKNAELFDAAGIPLMRIDHRSTDRDVTTVLVAIGVVPE